ncbi:MAG: IPT/TIG domain-containing protein [Candidatus Marinimicrobia bacterium]|nr:IPT/TIG domain-containing protein [Candidatus Neomarinimicrobiota bacterium]
MNTLSLFKVSPALLILCIACTETSYPDSLWNPDESEAPDPVITAVEPVEGVLGGVEEITISGENFSDDSDLNKVHIGGSRARVLSSTATQLVVLAPDLAGDSLKVHVATIGAYLFDVYDPYELFDPVINYGEFHKTKDRKSADAFGLAVDSLENLYVSVSPKQIIRVDPQGVPTLYATIDASKFDFMCMGPGGYLYGLLSQKYILRVLPEGTAIEVYQTPEKIIQLDFGSDGIAYAAGGGGKVFRLTTDGSISEAASYPWDVTINTIRVFGDYVYTAGFFAGNDTVNFIAGIWRHRIISGNTLLGDPELVFDWGSFAGKFGPVINDMTFTGTGDLLLAASEEIALYILKEPYDQNSPQQFYPFVGELEPPINAIVWGQGRYAYINYKPSDADTRTVKRVTMTVDGAPYWGRK